MQVPRALRPLTNPAYRWLAAALVSSLIGSGIWMVALVWQIIALGGGAADLSLVAGAAAVGMLLTTLLGGALADRIPQKRILLVVEATRAVTVGIVALLAISGMLQVWQLALVALIGGVMAGMYYPAYSALLPTVLPQDQLLSANGFEGMTRPVLAQAAGPAAASALIAITSPGMALLVAALSGVVAVLFIIRIPALPVRQEPAADGRHPAVALLLDVRDGFSYMGRTPWLLGTLVFASLMILVMMGPFEVLVPFAIKDNAGGGPAQHSLVLAAFGIGGAVGSLVIASLKLPRRYLTVMVSLWAVGCVPLIVFGVTDQVWLMVIAAFVVGAMFNGGVVIWGTLLQRRVPSHMLGRVSSLDFFVSLAFMPLSMAIAGPAGQLLGLPVTFLIVGLVPLLIGLVAIITARMTTDEIAHPLDTATEEAEAPAEPAVVVVPERELEEACV